MEFTEKDVSAFARLREGKMAQFRETRCLLEKRSRQLMEQSALLEHDIDTFKNELATIGIRDYLTGVAHVCACSPLCHAIWSMLPVEHWQRIFARLPLPDIVRLRLLSKTWDKHVTGVTPGFTKLCAEQNPNMLGLVIGNDGPMWIILYNSKEKRWHFCMHETCLLGSSVTMFAGDGGLVCLVSSAQHKEMEIAVLNPLTRQRRKLPSSSSLSRIRPCMVQLVMDRDSNCYKVLVVGHKEQSEGDTVARIFSSATGKWSKPNISSDLIFGCQYSWESIPSSYGPDVRRIVKQNISSCAYDCANSTLLELDDGSYRSRSGVRSVLVKDRLFVLQVNHNHEYFLTEYQAQCSKLRWVRLKVHKCYELDAVSRWRRNVELGTRLFGYQDFLLVIAYGGCKDDSSHEQTLLFDLSTSQWQIIPEIPRWGPTERAHDMFELRWDAVP